MRNITIFNVLVKVADRGEFAFCYSCSMINHKGYVERQNPFSAHEPTFYVGYSKSTFLGSWVHANVLTPHVL